MTDELRAVGSSQLVLIPNPKLPNMKNPNGPSIEDIDDMHDAQADKLREEHTRIRCPHCNEAMEDSEDWGCPDTDWEEDGQCPYCEKEFRWRRTLHHCTYTMEKKEPGDMDPDYFGKILPEGERLCIQCGKIHRTDEACPRNENSD